MSRFIILIAAVATMAVIQVQGVVPRDYTFSSSLISMRDGLPDNNVNCMIQDAKGFMWFGTRNGLSCYDGFRFVNHYQADEKGISHNYIRSLHETGDGLLWIGTNGGGLNVYHKETETFHRFGFAWADSMMVESSILDRKLPDRIYSIVSRKRGELWIGTQSGLYRLLYTQDGVPSVNSLKRYRASSHDENSICDNKIFHLMFDSQGVLWISSNEGGLSRFWPEEERFRKYRAGEEAGDLPSNQVMVTYEDSREQVWVGTWEHGLCLYDRERDQFKQYLSSGQNPDLIGNNIYKIMEGSHGQLWLGAIYAGLDRISLEEFGKGNSLFHHHWLEDGGENLVNSNVILSMGRSSDGILWVSTQGLGVYRIRTGMNFLQRVVSSGEGEGLSGNDVTVISTDYEERYWVGTWRDGLNLATLEEGRFRVLKSFRHNAQPQSLSSDSVYAVLTDSDSITWVGAWPGLTQVVEEAGNVTFRRVKCFDTAGVEVELMVNSLHEDHEGVMWVGTEGNGLWYRERGQDTLLRYSEPQEFGKVTSVLSCESSLPGVSKEVWIGTHIGVRRVLFSNEGSKSMAYYSRGGDSGLPGNQIRNFVKVDSILWIGTSQGVGRFNLVTNEMCIERYFPGHDIMSMLCDSTGNIWIGTISGLIRYDRKVKRQAGFYENAHGIIQGYNHNASCLDEGGTCLFGTNQGLVFFDRHIEEEVFQPEVVFTDLSVNGKKVKPGEWVDGSTLLEKRITETSRIKLKHSQGIFSVEFAALSYDEPGDRTFAYKLVGMQEVWTYAPVERAFAAFSNLPAGEYTLQVKLVNNDNTGDNDPAELHITILPPLWRTKVAYFLYTLLLVLVAFLLRRATVDRLRLHETVRFEKFKREQEEELNKQRLTLFTDISHELRTPLTLIAGPLEQVIQQKEKDPGVREKLNTIKNNSQKLLRLINQLLDFRKIEMGMEKLNAANTEAVSLTRTIFEEFRDEAADREIDYRFRSGKERCEVWLEEEKYERIIGNLLSNALKYTGENGKVVLSVEEIERDGEDDGEFEIFFGKLPSGHFLQLEVRDTGRGIAKADREHIFDRFYRVKSTRSRVDGTGIGLSMVRQLVLMHYGQLGLISEPGEGSRFVVRLPLGSQHLKSHEMSVGQEKQFSMEHPEIEIPIVKGSGRKKILLVEDSHEMRHFIVDVLKPHYAVLEAENGNRGLEYAMEVMPDLIVSDVMMPEMDGIEFCKRVRGNIGTSHIPFLLLTARSSVEYSIEGLKAGADDYISKPFSPEVLLLKIRNIFERREKLMERFSLDLQPAPESIATNPTDNDFLVRLIGFIDNNLDNSELDLELFTGEFGMSRSTFNRKLKQLTNHSPADFVNNYRMKIAARMLLDGNHAIKTIAFHVGYADARYFSTRFKKHFGLTPTQYQEQHRTV
ncbi:MAG: two-component regulator propeller domain-containing protein [Bacteroidota bacterium]